PAIVTVSPFGGPVTESTETNGSVLIAFAASRARSRPPSVTSVPRGRGPGGGGAPTTAMSNRAGVTAEMPYSAPSTEARLPFAKPATPLTSITVAPTGAWTSTAVLAGLPPAIGDAS